MNPVSLLLHRLAFAALSLALAMPARAGGPLPPGFSESVFTSGLNEPVSMAWAPDASGRLFITEKSGGIRVIANGALLATPFATFPQLYTESECGVLGLCFDPNYTVNRYVYVFVTVSSTEQRIVRFTDQNSQGVDRANIVTKLPTRGANHDGGALAFGHDGKLYWAIGDNGDKRGVDGNLTGLAAKVGRANPDGSVPADNPFNDGTGPRNDYIWATGFRNPFTMTFQPRTGKLWLNVVGSTPDGQTEPNSGPGYEQIFVLKAGDDGGYDDYEGNQPNGHRYSTPFVRPFAHPVLQYKTSNQDEPDYHRDVLTISRIGGIATVGTSAAHPYRVGQAVRIAGASNAGFNGTLCVRSVPTAASFTAVSFGADGSASGGTARPLVIGSTVAGGAFYESSAFPAEYRGNFFFGDYSGGGVMRAVFDAQNRLTDLSVFSTGAFAPVDAAVGPDGALYIGDIGAGEIRRIAWNQAPADLIVTPTTFNMIEGGRAKFTVRLGAAPAGNVAVTIHRTSSDEDESVGNGGALTFNAANWNVPQSVTVAAAPDADSDTDRAAFSVSAPGFAEESVNVSVTDNTGIAPVLSTNTLTIMEGESGVFFVSLPQRPAKSVTVAVRRTDGPATARIIRGGALVFTPANFSTPQKVKIFADEDADNTGTSATFTVKAAGYARRSVIVQLPDNDPRAPVFKTTPPTQTVVGLAFRYAAKAKGLPAPQYSLLVAPAGMTIDASTGLVQWTPTQTGDYPVTIKARNGVGPFAKQTFTLTVATDQPPATYLTAPAEGAILSGANAEFFGSASDDYGCYKAEFYIDDVLRYTDLNRESHYHLNGAHQLFDTTPLSNGPHTLKMIVFDDKNRTATATVQVTVSN